MSEREAGDAVGAKAGPAGAKARSDGFRFKPVQGPERVRRLVERIEGWKCCRCGAEDAVGEMTLAALARLPADLVGDAEAAADAVVTDGVMAARWRLWLCEPCLWAVRDLVIGPYRRRQAADLKAMRERMAGKQPTAKVERPAAVPSTTGRPTRARPKRVAKPKRKSN